MSQVSVRERLDRMRSQSAAHAPSSLQSSAPYSNPARLHEKARTRREKLDKALYLLAQGGIEGHAAYPSLFIKLARKGIILKPLQFWSALGLFLYDFVIFLLVFAFFLYLGGIIGKVPAFVELLLIRGGPDVVLLAISAIAAVITLRFRIQAVRLGLPKWRDL